MLWARLTNLSKGWQVHREMSVAALGNIKAPLDYRDTWQRACDDITDQDFVQRACDDITDQDLEGSDDADTTAELLRKPRTRRADALALRWKTKTVAIWSSLEATTGDQTGALRRTSIRLLGTPPSATSRSASGTRGQSQSCLSQ